MTMWPNRAHSAFVGLAVLAVLLAVGQSSAASSQRRYAVVVQHDDQDAATRPIIGGGVVVDVDRSGVALDKRSAGAGGAGLQAVVTEAGVAVVQRALRPQFVNQLLASFQLPPIVGKQTIKVLGLSVEIDYAVSNVSITDVTFDKDEVDLVPRATGAGVGFSVADGGATITADFAYRIPSPIVNLQGNGQAVIDASQIGVQLQVNVDADEQGYPVLSLPVSSVVLGQFSTKINTSSSILDVIVDFFLSLFNGVVKSEIQTAINNALTSALSLNGSINTMIHNQSLCIGLPPNGSQVAIDISLPYSPSSSADNLLIPVKGEVFMASGQHSNYTPAVIPANVTNQMLQFSLGKYVFDTAGWAYYKSGLLNYLITNSDLPSWLPFKLNTATFTYLIPMLYKLYPNRDMNIDFFASKPINFTITPASQTQGIGVGLVADMVVNVIAENGSVINVFDLETTFKLHFTLYFNNASVHGKFNIASFNTVIKSSQIGTFDVSVISFILDALFDNVLLYPVNLYLSVVPLFGFPTIAGFHFVNPSFVYQTDFVTLSSDFAFDNTTSLVRPRHPQA